MTLQNTKSSEDDLLKRAEKFGGDLEALAQIAERLDEALEDVIRQRDCAFTKIQELEEENNRLLSELSSAQE